MKKIYQFLLMTVVAVTMPVVFASAAVKDCGTDDAIDLKSDTSALVCFVKAANTCQEAKMNVKHLDYGLVKVSIGADCKLTTTLPQASDITNTEYKSVGGTYFTCAIKAKDMIAPEMFVDSKNVTSDEVKLLFRSGPGMSFVDVTLQMVAAMNDCQGTYLQSPWYLEFLKPLQIESEAEAAAQKLRRAKAWPAEKLTKFKYKIDLKSGSINLFARDVVYTSSDSALEAYNITNGKLKWSFKMLMNADSLLPVIYDKTIYKVSTEGVYAINLANGAKKWYASFNGSGLPGFLGIANKSLYVDYNHKMLVYNLTNGKLIKSFDLPSWHTDCELMLIRDGLYYCRYDYEGKTDLIAYKLNDSSYRKQWTVSSVRYSDDSYGRVKYFYFDNKFIYVGDKAHDIKTGKLNQARMKQQQKLDTILKGEIANADNDQDNPVFLGDNSNSYGLSGDTKCGSHYNGDEKNLTVYCLTGKKTPWKKYLITDPATDLGFPGREINGPYIYGKNLVFSHKDLDSSYLYGYSIK